MTNHQIELVQSSFELVAPILESATMTFMIGSFSLTLRCVACSGRRRKSRRGNWLTS